MNISTMTTREMSRVLVLVLGPVHIGKVRTTAEVYHHPIGMIWTGIRCRDPMALELCCIQGSAGLSACFVEWDQELHRRTGRVTRRG